MSDEEENVDTVLAEAQALMEEMNNSNANANDEGEGVGSNSIVIDGFSIDDVFGDDSDERPIIDARTAATATATTAAAAATTATATTATATNHNITKVEMGNDPLSLIASPAAEAPPASSTRRSSLTMHPLYDEQVKPTTTPTTPTLSTPSLADVKARATGFASSMASFAQKAAAGVAAAAANSAAEANHAATNINNNMILQASPLSNNSNNSNNHQQQQQQQHAAQPLPIVLAELDNDQKTALIAQHLGTLLPGERVIMFLSNLLHVSDSSGWDYTTATTTATATATGNGTNSGMWCCCMTFYRVVLFHTGNNNNNNSSTSTAMPSDWDEDCWPQMPEACMLQMPLASMDRVEKSIYTTSQNTTLMGLVMYGKDNGRQLKFTTPSYADTLRVHESIQTYAFPGRRNLGYLFAFESKRSNVMSSIVVDNSSGKKAITLPPIPRRFDGVTEFIRQFGNMQPCPWTLYTQINATYQLSMSYPSILAGPSSLPEASQETQRVLRQCAAFRSEQRLVALTWSSGVDGASLWRASQPKVGLQGNRNAADEFYLRHIAESAASSNSLRLDARTHKPSRAYIQKLTGQTDMGIAVDPGTTLKIMDMRPRASAMANRTSGYGYENTSHYVGTTLQFCNIANIHSVRDAYQKMSAHCMSPTTQDQNWNSLIEDTKWLHHIRQIWAAAWEAAFWIHVHRLPVLLHCSHGWDRTSQVAVLAELLLDPYYRTTAGFACLIEKDFLSFGHPFHTRCAHGEGRGGETPSSGGSDEGQISPIFMQFLDCVYQLIKLYPEKFEFNETYLLVLSEHVYSCRFGTLLCDTERERELVAGIRQRTHSVWDYLESRPDCVNRGVDSYKPSDKVLLMPLPTLLRNISLWTDRHAMYGPKATSRFPISPLDLVPAKGVAAVAAAVDETTSAVTPAMEDASTPPPVETESSSTPSTTTTTEEPTAEA